MSELFEQLQRRIDDAGARAVSATAALLDRLDHLVPVARSLAQRIEDEIPNATALGSRWRPAEPIAEPLRRAAAPEVATPRPTPAAPHVPFEMMMMVHLHCSSAARRRALSIHRDTSYRYI